MLAIDRQLLIGNCFFRTAFTERCAGEGELAFGLTKHRVILPEHGLAWQPAVFARLRGACRPGKGSGERAGAESGLGASRLRPGCRECRYRGNGCLAQKAATGLAGRSEHGCLVLRNRSAGARKHS
jgi:hypothetical protein